MDIKGSGDSFTFDTEYVTGSRMGAGNIVLSGALSSTNIYMAKSDYSVKGSKNILGLQYDFTKNFHLKVAYQMEKYDVTYPGYLTLFSSSDASFNQKVFISGNLFAEQTTNFSKTETPPTYDLINKQMAYGKGDLAKTTPL